VTTSVPELATLDWRVVVLTLLSAVMLFRLHWGIAKMLGAVAAIALLLAQI
jgi:hypothetical protein